MSNELKEIFSIAGPIVGPIIIALIGYFINRWGNKAKFKELTMAQEALEQKLILDKEAADQAKQKNEADLSNQFLNIAKASGDQVITRDVTIKELQNALKDQQNTLKSQQISIDNLQTQVTSLLTDKRKLEDESIRKDERISALEAENKKLVDRVQALETELKTVKGDYPS